MEGGSHFHCVWQLYIGNGYFNVNSRVRVVVVSGLKYSIVCIDTATNHRVVLLETNEDLALRVIEGEFRGEDYLQLTSCFEEYHWLEGEREGSGHTHSRYLGTNDMHYQLTGLARHSTEPSEHLVN